MEKYKDILGEKLDFENYINEGQNAIILKYKENPEFILKIKKPFKNGLEKEFQNHKKFFEAYYNLTNGLENINKYTNVKIPEINKIKGENINDIFLIEKIEGQSILDETMIEILNLDNKVNKRKIFEELEQNNYSTYMDIVVKANNKVKERLGISAYYGYDGFSVKRMIDEKVNNPVVNLFRDIYNNYGYLHNDFHPGNIMVNGDNTIIIDFGNILEH